MALSQIIRNKLPAALERMQSLIARLEQEHDAAQTALSRAQEAHAGALVDAAERGAPPPNHAHLRKELESARERAADTAAALLTARARLQAATEAQRTGADRWAKGIKAADARNDALLVLQDRIDALVQAWNKVAALTVDMATELPAILDHDAALVRAHQLGDLVRQELWRQGFDWAVARSASQRVTTPTLADIVSGIPGMVRRWRDEAAGGQ